MSRLFLFSIGGTGSRIVRSLAHLLAAGLELRPPGSERMELVPILIDTDATNKDTLDAVALLELYQTLHRERGPGAGKGFFATDVKKLSDIAEKESSGISTTFRSNFQSVANTSFGEFIAFTQIEDSPTRHLLQALYSEENFSEKLTGGFLGNPNVGAAVLAAFKDAPDFKLFARIFRQGDRIAVLNSIFGGTGAAGLPWLLKWLRSTQQVHGAAQAIRSAPTCAVTVLPYFQVQDSDTSRINSSSFVTKTKAALSYYARNIGDVNALYYLGDPVQAIYPNHESGSKQSNPAHLLELLAAAAVLDFVGRRDEDLLGSRGIHEFALAQDTVRVHLSTLGPELEERIGGPLTQLHILSLLSHKHLPAAGQQTWAKENGLGRTLFASYKYREGLGTYLDSFYRPWIEQLDGNDRHFSPFDLQVGDADMSRLIRDRPMEKHFFQKRVNAEMFDDTLNKLKTSSAGTEGEMSRLLDLAWHGTAEMTKRLQQQ